jgi:hypothetical protein
LWDVATAYDDGTGRPIANYTFDGIHPTQLGSQHGGQSLVAVLRTLITPAARWMAADSINLISNGRMLGTAGVSGSNTTGTVASGYTAQAVDGGSRSSIVADLLPNPATGGSIQRLRIATPGSGSGFEIFGYYGASLTPPGNIWVKARARISLSAWTGWRSIYFNAGYVDCMGSPATTSKIDADSTLELELESMPFLLPASPSAIEPYLWVYVDPGATGTGTLEVKEIEMIPVEDPVDLHSRGRSKS